MNRIYLDVTDLIEFLTRSESPSGVQRVVAEVTPLLIVTNHAHPVVLDRTRGVFVELSAAETETLVIEGVRSSTHRATVNLATVASATIERAKTAQPALIDTSCTLVFLGALWINLSLIHI